MIWIGIDVFYNVANNKISFRQYLTSQIEDLRPFAIYLTFAFLWEINANNNMF